MLLNCYYHITPLPEALPEALPLTGMVSSTTIPSTTST
jgi:hypothetical protein